ncbi:uracil-DNA glycosylase [Aquibacillus salsiterrae]|uniref:Uracil-DNA glycosylase n=1 Tax=Aquibacillus salsiterrae TaxID=2950439 RepID=A0A9X3WFZ7_9BACI|nr:uracil-DNA glycosylase [Aquibacillus salsiterrae]MDC3417741.1 uracil-DNA glycosylase [Aquibacillus salsiterrae]
MLIPDKVHPSWTSFLTEEIKSELLEIETKIGTNFNPTKPENILRFLTTNLDEKRVIWLGQDVYPAEGVATGRAFEVGNLTSWNQPFRQISIKNIVRLIHKTYNHIESYDEIKSFTDIKHEIAENVFPIKPPKEWFNSLDEQGVLFLNKSFTCAIGKANSHQAIWQFFSKRVIRYISDRRPDMIWFLWGKEAKASDVFINHGKIYTSRHPMMCSKTYEDDFLKSNGFKETSHLINWLG